MNQKDITEAVKKTGDAVKKGYLITAAATK